MLEGQLSPAASPAGFKVDISRGERIGRVSSEWFSRPDDERYLSLGALYKSVRARAENATARTVETSAIRVEARTNDISHMALALPGRAERRKSAGRSATPRHGTASGKCHPLR